MSAWNLHARGWCCLISVDGGFVALQGYYDFADLVVFLHIAVSFYDFGEGEDAVNTRFEVAGFDAIEDVMLSFCAQRRVGKDFAEGVATDGEPFAQGGEQRKGRRFRGECAVFEDDAMKGGGLSQDLDTFADSGIEDYAGTLFLGDFTDARDEVFFLRSDDVVSAEFEQGGFFLGGSRGGDADGALGLNDFDWRRGRRCCWRR